MLAPFSVFCLLALFCNSVTAIYTVNQDYGQVITNFDKPITGQKSVVKKFLPTWESLDNRPLPNWYDNAKFGIFIHWGVFSVPSFGSEWFWNSWKTETGSTKYHDFMKQRYPPTFTYQDFAKEFTAEFYNATQWSEIFKASGAKYVVLTSKHHEGYTLWPSKYSFSWNSADVGPNRDLVGELATAIRKNTDIKFGLYHSLYEWFNPLWLADKKNNFTTNDFVMFKTLPELRELVELYKPEVVWSDGEWEAPDTYWKSKDFLAWLYNDSPVKDTVVVNDRWGHETLCHHGDFYTCSDRYNPGVLLPHKWENCLTIDKKSWGYRRNADLAEYMTIKDLVKELVTTVSCGGNVLVNVGPTKDGIIAPIYEQRLREIGDWLSINEKAIYNTIPWTHQNDTLTNDVWYTQNINGQDVYGCLLSWPEDNVLRLGAPKMPPGSPVFISVKGGEVQVKWTQNNDITEIHLPVEHHKGQPAWVIRLHYKVKAL